MRQSHRIASLAAMTVAAALAVASLVAYPLAADVARDAGREQVLASDVWLEIPFTGLAFSATALVIHWRRRNLVGWVMHGIGVLLAGSMIGTALYITHESSGAELTATGRVLGGWIWFGWEPAVVLLAVILPLLFPTGRPPSQRWWWVAGVAGAGLAYAFVSVTLESLTRPMAEVSGGSPIVEVAMVTGTFGAAASVITRYRRAGDIERHQIKWVSAALVLVCVTVAIALTPPAAGLMTRPLAQLAFMAVWWTVPVAIGIAISRYRLYDIDRIISRTVAYSLVALIVAAVYGGVVVLLGTTLGPRNDLSVAASTLAAAAVFNPARRRIQRATDRRFNRPRYHAQQELAAFAHRLRDQVELATVSQELLGVVDHTLHPASRTLWIRGAR